MACQLLMIDDNSIEHLIMKKMLCAYNLFPNASYTSDGQQVINSFKQAIHNEDQIPDVIFLDLNMPGLNGWGFLIQFNKLFPSFKKKIDVHIYSSSIDPSDRSRSKAYSFVKSFISKPVKKHTLEDLFSEYSNK